MLQNEERYNCFGNRNVSTFVFNQFMFEWTHIISVFYSRRWPDFKVAKKNEQFVKNCNDRNSFLNKIWEKFCMFYLCANVQQFWHPNYRQGQNKISVRYHDATPTVKRYTDDNDCVLYFTQPLWFWRWRYCPLIKN